MPFPGAPAHLLSARLKTVQEQLLANPETARLATVAAAEFTPCLNETFTLTLEDGATLPLVLVDVSERPKYRLIAEGRTPFKLLFQGPAAPLLPQAIYKVENAAVGALPIFIVPVGQDETSVYYEAVFN